MIARFVSLAALAAASATFWTASIAAANVDVYIAIGPPPPRLEVVPDPGPGYIAIAPGTTATTIAASVAGAVRDQKPEPGCAR